MTIACPAATLNAATPSITPDLPWLSDVPIVFAIMMRLIIGLLCRIKNRAAKGWMTQKDRAAEIPTNKPGLVAKLLP